MDKDKILADIFNSDPLGLLNNKPDNSPARNEDERLVASFQEINAFYENNNREPLQGGGIQEHQLFTRLKSLRGSASKIDMLKPHDKFGLLDFEIKIIHSFDDIFNDDRLGILNDDSEGLFDLKHITQADERSSTDFVARRKPCKDFDKYEAQFKEVQKDLKSGQRKIIEFKQSNLKQGAYYVHNGILFLVEKIEITTEEHYKPDGTRVREDGRTRCVFENGTESNMKKRSVEKILYANGRVVSDNVEEGNESFLETFGNITADDKEEGFIYILKSKSDKQEIQEIQNLYKIGFSKTKVENRVKNAIHEPTYLMADVRIVMTYQCYNMNPQKLEGLLHNFFGKSCLNIDVFDQEGRRYTPREWFIAPIEIIHQAIQLIKSGEIVKYKYNIATEEIDERIC